METGLTQLVTVAAGLLAAEVSIDAGPDMQVVSGTTRGRDLVGSRSTALAAGRAVVVRAYDVDRTFDDEELRVLEQVASVAAGLVESHLGVPDPQARSTFVHEVKTPLTAVLGFAPLLAAAVEDDPTASAVAERITAAGHDVLAAVDASS